MDWISSKNGFKEFLLLEKSLSKNTISAYLHDVNLLHNFLNTKKMDLSPIQVSRTELEKFIAWINEMGMKDFIEVI